MAMPSVASFRGYVFISILLSAAVLSHAIYTKKFFYGTVVYLSHSKLAIMCAANIALVSILLIWRLTQLIFLGPLRFRELERLHLRARDAIIEYCFAISVFREDFNTRFVALIMTVLLLKSLHWLAKDRTEYLEEQIRCPLRTHVRLVGLLMLLAFLDCFLAMRCIQATLQSNGRSMFVLFSFEFTLLVIELAANVFQYIFFLIDQRMDGRWGSKGVFSFYAELLCDLSTLTIYIVFFIYVQIYYSFPYHIIREFYVTLSKFQRKCADFLRYRRVVANIHEVVEEVSEEELQQGDRTCIICREEMESAIKLACGHMFHRRCLENWLKRQLSCPTCRATIDVNRSAQSQEGNADQNANANQQRAANAAAAQPANPNQPQRPTLQPGRQPAQRPQMPPRQQAGQQGPAQNANIGEAGARLLNFANQWINQVMNEAGMRPQANAQNPNAPNPNNAQANHHHHHHHHHQHHHRHHPNAANMAQAQNRQAGAHANQQQAQAQNHNAFLNFHPGVPGPNALAHMQLRARRRGVFAGLRQYPTMYRVHLPPLNNAANAMNNTPNHNANATTQGQPPASGAPEQSGAQSNSNSDNQSSAPQQAVAGSSSATATASASNAANPFASVQMASSAASSAIRGDSQTASTAQGGQASRPNAAMQIRNLRGELGGAGAQTLPLERLFEIQRQIEVLRSEVQSLVLHATEAQLSAMESEEQQNVGGDGSEIESRDGQGATATEAALVGGSVAESSGHTEGANANAEAASADDVVENEDAAGVEEGGDQGEVVDTQEKAESSTGAAVEGSGGENVVRQNEEDSEAERIRRRRIEFLERTSGS